MSLFLLFGILAAISFGLTWWQLAAAWRFPLHQRPSAIQHFPGITVLKPLKGFEPHLRDCLRSWLDQEYPGPVQFLFGVADPADPIGPVMEELLREHPGRDARLVVCPLALGANAKVSTLTQLQSLATQEVILVSDDDVMVSRDFLAGLAGSLGDPNTGLVNCFYLLPNPGPWATRWEALAINADFWSQVLQSQMMRPLDFALGAVMAVPRPVLDRIGGFAALADYLADDYRLGHLVAAAGKRIVLSPLVVETRSKPLTWRQTWQHQLRWARTIRFCKPLPYFLSLISNPTLWPLLWATSGPSSTVLAIVGMSLGWRIAQAAWLEHRLTRSWKGLTYAWLAPMKDLLQVGLWMASWIGTEVTWRGERFRILRGGRLVRLG